MPRLTRHRTEKEGGTARAAIRDAERAKKQMSVQDMRQGRAGSEDVGALIRGLRVMADAGVVNGPRDKAALRQAAGMIERLAFLPDEKDRDWAALIEENNRANQQCRKLEAKLEFKEMMLESAMKGYCTHGGGEICEHFQAATQGADPLRPADAGHLPQGGGFTGAGGAPAMRPGIDFEAPAPTELW